jgi:hypothetical protein
VPKEIMAVIDDHDDIDWIAVVPNKYKKEYISWLQVGHFACCRVREFEMPYCTIHVGYHA